MPDIITAAEQDAIAAFLAAGGKITKLPPRYVVPVTGAAPMTDGIASTVREKTAREKWSEAAEKAKREKKRKAAERKRKLLSSEERRARAAANLELVQQRTRERVAKKVGEALRMIGADWTWPTITAASKALGYKTAKGLTQFLRHHGHGDKIPPREYVKRGGGGKSKYVRKDHAARNAGMLADYDAGMRVCDILSKWHSSGRILRRLLEQTGRERRAVSKNCEAVKRIAERDAAIRREYETGATREQLCAKYGIGCRALTRAIRRAGGDVKLDARGRPRMSLEQLQARDETIRAAYDAGEPMKSLVQKFGLRRAAILIAVRRAGGSRRPLRKRGKAPPSQRDIQIAALYSSGMSAYAAGKQLGVSTDVVYSALVRCGVERRSHKGAAWIVRAESGVETRHEAVIRLHSEGVSTAQIAQQLGYTDPRSVRKVISAWRASQQVSLFAEAAQ